DEAGGIATIATILASNNLSIKNIGILHNREFENGVLHIEMYDAPSLEQAVTLLRKYHYTVYER
ncbi:MAG: prephenate dehydrogenase/arogenate dehydrogenase family protein, partial [Lachnospiraceae bacterium]|nr:prephenate dehydrogenase/arogenate dehydrogenase family protein [Lachnospiraceae bacterium]